MKNIQKKIKNQKKIKPNIINSRKIKQKKINYHKTKMKKRRKKRKTKNNDHSFHYKKINDEQKMKKTHFQIYLEVFPLHYKIRLTYFSEQLKSKFSFCKQKYPVHSLNLYSNFHQTPNRMIYKYIFPCFEIFHLQSTLHKYRH